MRYHGSMHSKTATILALTIVLAFAACSPRQEQRSDQGQLAPADLNPKAIYRLPDDPFSTVKSPPTKLVQTMATLPQRIDDPEILWVMAQCGCHPMAQVDVYKKLALARGVLPQLLVPTVREEIRKNPQLRTLLSLPELFGGLFKRILTSDQSLSNQVRDGLSQKIQAGVGGILKNDVPFRFDHFVSPGRDLQESFAVADMAARWNLIFATPNLWQGQTPIAFNSHGLQVLESLRVLSEWKYLFGIDPNSMGGFYGGLAIDADGRANNQLKRFDPREEPSAQRIVSGQYQLVIREGQALDLVINVKESWQRGPEEPTITEQAMLWNSAALAFMRLRPDRRTAATSRLFGPEGQALLPTDAHMLPLIFLPGMQGVLEGRMANVPNRVISDPSKPSERVSYRSLAKLGRAIMTWILALEKIESAKIPEAQREQLKAAPTQLREALRLVVHNILKDQALRNPSRNHTVAEIAEALAFLADVEQKLLPSLHLEETVIDAFHRFASARLAPIWTGQGTEAMSLDDILWTNMALTSIARYPAEIADASWLPLLTQKFQAFAGKREAWP